MSNPDSSIASSPVPSTANGASGEPGAPFSGRPDRLILVYDGDSGLKAMLLDVVKKAVGREECALCEITYSPLGKKGAWRACETRLCVAVDELHRDNLPPQWGISRSSLPCVLAQVADQRPFVLVPRDKIAACRGSVDALEALLVGALAAADQIGQR